MTCALLVAAGATPARAEMSTPAERRAEAALHRAAVDRLMTGLRRESIRHASQIRAVYESQVGRLGIDDRRELRGERLGHRLISLPLQPSRYNVRLRLRGNHPVGEMDLPNQRLYLAARPETIGCLLQVAGRVQSGPIEVTSLVRHAEYQNRLARVNVNARTAVPTHAMGLAFDISTLQTPLRTVWEIRDVLRRMAADGELLFVAERRQLVFHVVPTPPRQAYFAAIGEGLITVPPARLAPWRWSPAARSAPPPLAAFHPATSSLLASSAIAVLPVLVLVKADVRRLWRGRAARRTAPAHVEGLR